METGLAVAQAKYWHLKQVDLFEGLPSSDLRTLGDFFDVELFEEGQEIYRVGDRSDRIYILKSGKVKLCRTSEDGKELILGFVGPGGVFGELAIADEEVRGETARAVEDAFVCSIHSDKFEEFLVRHPEVALQIAAIIGTRKTAIERRVLDLVSKDVRTRLAHTLVELADAYGIPDEKGTRIDLRLTQSDLAQVVGSTRETTSTVFNEFRRAGLVDSEGRHLWVLNREALVAYPDAASNGRNRAA